MTGVLSDGREEMPVDEERPLPLEGVRVLDLTSVVVGPACTLRLAEYGAEVIKIESPGGDIMRTLGGASPSGAHSGKYLHFNRGKRSVCLDLKKPEGLGVVLRLLEECDVFVSNLRPDALDRLGLGKEEITRRFPRLIYCVVTGFGPGGAYRGRPAYDSVVQAVSGVAGLFAHGGGAPRYAPLLFADHVVGEIAAGAVLAYLLRRERTGKGAAVEVPMFETMAAFVLKEHLGPASFDPPIGPPGDMRVLVPGNRPMRTADGWLSVTANTDGQAATLLRLLGCEWALQDPRFESVGARIAHIGEWFELCSLHMTKRKTAEWLEDFASHDLPAMPCHSLESLAGDDHLVSVGLLQPDMHMTDGAVAAIRSTVLEEEQPLPMTTVAAPLGWDTLGVLRQAGYRDDEIDRLLAGGAAHLAPSAPDRPA